MNTINRTAVPGNEKFLLTYRQYQAILKGIAPHVDDDGYRYDTVCNIYYDTADYRLLRDGETATLRLRGFGAVCGADEVLVELKTRSAAYRAELPAVDAVRWLRGDAPSDVSRTDPEIDRFLQSLRPEPKVFIGYDRETYAGAEDSALRVCFDTGLRWRDTEVDLRCGDHGTYLLPESAVLMEVDCGGAVPAWLAALLRENRAQAVSFSAYAAYYADIVMDGRKEILKSA